MLAMIALVVAAARVGPALSPWWAFIAVGLVMIVYGLTHPKKE